MTDKMFLGNLLSLTATCSDCGARLGVGIGGEDRVRMVPDVDNPAPNNPGGTGSGIYAAAVEVAVTPCRGCIDKEVSPARRLADALAAMRTEG